MQARSCGLNKPACCLSKRSLGCVIPPAVEDQGLSSVSFLSGVALWMHTAYGPWNCGSLRYSFSRLIQLYLVCTHCSYSRWSIGACCQVRYKNLHVVHCCQSLPPASIGKCRRRKSWEFVIHNWVKALCKLLSTQQEESGNTITCWILAPYFQLVYTALV